MSKTILTPEQQKALNEASAQAMELYLEKLKDAFPSTGALREALTGHTHVHTGVAFTDGELKPLLGLRLIFEFMTQEELNRCMSGGQA